MKTLQELKEARERRLSIKNSTSSISEYKNELSRSTQRLYYTNNYDRLSAKRAESKLEKTRIRLESPSTNSLEERLKLGKEWEKKVASILLSYGYSVEDISERQYILKGKLKYYPFDLLVTFKNNISLLIDVKYRRSDKASFSDLWIYKSKLEEYYTFKEIKSNEKLIVLCNNKRIIYSNLTNIRGIGGHESKPISELKDMVRDMYD